MAITEYSANEGTRFEVYVNLRSKINSTIRFQKRVKDLKSLNAAKKEEKKQIRLITERIHKKEGLGLSWSDILYRWEVYQKSPQGRNYSDNLIKDYLGTLRKWTKAWTNIPIGKLTRADGREMFDYIECEGLAKSYQKKIKRLIKMIFDWAVERRFLPSDAVSPLKEIKLKKDEEKIPEILTMDEIRSLLLLAKRLEHPWFPVWATALLTGMRSGELYALTWENVDLERDLILVHRNYSTADREIGPTKGRYWRTVPISSELKSLYPFYESA